MAKPKNLNDRIENQESEPENLNDSIEELESKLEVKKSELDKLTAEKEKNTLNYDLADSLHTENKKKVAIIDKVSSLIYLDPTLKDVTDIKNKVLTMLNMAESTLTQTYQTVENAIALNKYISKIKNKDKLSPDIVADSAKANEVIALAYTDAQTAYQNTITALKAVIDLEIKLIEVNSNLQKVSSPNKDIAEIKEHFNDILDKSKTYLKKCGNLKNTIDKNFNDTTIKFKELQEKLQVKKEEKAVIEAINA